MRDDDPFLKGVIIAFWVIIGFFIAKVIYT